MGQKGRGPEQAGAKNYPERSVVSAHPSGLHILVRVLPVYLAAAALILFVAGVLRDPRSFSNAVLLGSGLALGALGAADRLAEATGPVARLLALALGLLVAFGPVLVASYLVLNGITVVRREGLRPVNLLSLLAGLGIFGLIGLMIATLLARSPDLTVPYSSATRRSTSASAR
jgi:4-amino-4-deoxy-L-arabinose transferase-like glycosyltransferase